MDSRRSPLDHLGLLADATTRFAHALERAEPDRRAGFWWRRPLPEVLVHLGDVRSVDDAGPAALAGVPAEVCADGVDELLQVMPTRLGRTRTPLPGPLVLHVWGRGAPAEAFRDPAVLRAFDRAPCR